MLLLLATLSALASPCPPSFVFVGAPSCVELTYADGQTEVRNRCEHLLLVDQSVQGTFAPVAPGETTHVRDLQAFTVGMDGELYRAVALIQEACDDPGAPAPTEPGPAVELAAAPSDTAAP